MTEKDIEDHISCLEFYICCEFYFSFWLCLVKSLRNMSDNKLNYIFTTQCFQKKYHQIGLGFLLAVLVMMFNLHPHTRTHRHRPAHTHIFLCRRFVVTLSERSTLVWVCRCCFAYCFGMEVLLSRNFIPKSIPYSLFQGFICLAY